MVERVDAVDLEVAAVLLLNQPGGQRPWQRDVCTGSGNKPSHVPGFGDVAQGLRVGGREEQIVVVKHCAKPREKPFASS